MIDHTSFSRRLTPFDEQVQKARRREHSAMSATDKRNALRIRNLRMTVVLLVASWAAFGVWYWVR